MIASVSITSILTTIITASIQVQKPIIRAFCKSSSLKSIARPSGPSLLFMYYITNYMRHEQRQYILYT